LRKAFSLALLPFFSVLPLLSQQSAPITVNVSAVNLLATVRDKHGNLINTLTKDDFSLTQDDKPQTITYFAKESDLPLTLGLLVDTSMSQRRVLDQELSASHSFFDHVLREDKDKAFLIHFDREVELLQDLTSSRQKLQAAIDQIHSPQYSQASSSGGSSGGGGGGHGSHGHGGGGTLLYDAVYLASDELMKKQQGRKAIIILTDGVDHGSKETLAEAIETAQRADTLVYCILFADKDEHDGGSGFGGPHMGGRGGMGGGGMGRGGGGYPGRTGESRPDGKKVLEQLSKTTGGHFFEVTKKQTLDKIYAAIDEELRHQYVLGYSPDKPDATVGYHQLHLSVKQKDLVVQTRDGFYLDH
jgi:VWFA-related protein